ncbi:MAG: ATP-binding cassette domain-containing protein [bacterium]|nr:ATP-binding cassette domain-containing protein [bacterium]MDY4979698.1 ATP-binding cassette domain-containing protein [Candidatus Onthovivens sp.]
MSNLVFKNVNKIYDNNVQAVFDFNLEVNDKEFIVFVGPSGCGKSTTLRMVAGLESITSGEIYLDNVLVNDIAPVDRNMAMVFQNYALYPHMSVYENLAFGLKMRKFPVEILDENNNHILVVDKNLIASLKYDNSLLKKKNKIALKNIRNIEKGKEKNLKKDELLEGISKNNEEIKKNEEKILELQKTPSTYKFKMVRMPKEQIDEKVQYAAEILGLKPYLKRKPAALSGGQRQRVALGRAIVRNPKVFLMDEPLSNLDAKLRVQMRSEITKIHKTVGATTIYVTHDQTEAMTMADRMVVMKDGYIQQIGTPKELYNNPINIFVAGFIGAPAMNFIKGKFDGERFMIYKIEECDDDNAKELATETDTFIELTPTLKDRLKDYINKDIVLGIRPEDVLLVDDNKGKNVLTIKSEISELLGTETIIYGTINNQALNLKTNKEIDSKNQKEFYVSLKLEKAHVFDIETTNVIK